MNNPIFKAGTKGGTHRLGGIGVEKTIRIRSIRSPQAHVDESKVKKFARFTKNQPGLPTVSHAGNGVYTAKDGNNRIAAALRQGKRVMKVRVQKLSANTPLIQLMQDTSDPVPRADLSRPIQKRKPIRPRSPIRQLSAFLNSLIEFAPGISKKYAAGTQWDQDIATKDDLSGKLKAQPSLAKEYHNAVIKQAEPRIRGTKINRREEPFIGEVGHKSFNPAAVKEYESDLLYKQKNVPHPRKPGKTYTRREIDDEGGRRGVKASDLRNTEGYRALKGRQISQQDAPHIRQGYSEADLIARDVKERDRPALRRGIDADPAGKREVLKAHAGMRRKLVAGDVKPEIKNIRSAIAEDTDINRRLVHAIRKERGESGKGGFFREPEAGILPFNPAAKEDAMADQKKLLGQARGNFDTIMEGETERRKAQAGALHENVRKRAHEALVTREHGEGWRGRLGEKGAAKALQAHAKKASDYASSITAQLPVRQDELADLLKAKPEGMEKARQQYHSLLNPDSRTHRKIQNRIIRSGKVFDGTPAFNPPEPKVIAKKGFPTLKKIGITGAALGVGALGYHLLKKRREQEPQKQLMSSRRRLIQFGKKIPNKFNIKGNPEVERLLNKLAGTAGKNEAKFAGGKMPGPEAPASQWGQIEAAQDISPEATELVEGARKRVRKALAKPGGIKKMKPHDLVGDKMAEDLSPMSKGRIGNELKKLYGNGNPARPLRGSRAAFAQGRIESTPVERGDVSGVMEALKTDSVEKAQRHLAVNRPIIARNIRADRNAKRGYIQKTGQDPDEAVSRMKSLLIGAQGDKRRAEHAASKGIAQAREQAHAEVGAVKKSSGAAKQEALNKQAAGHKQLLDKARSVGWRNAAIGTGVGFIGGAAIAGNASRQTYEPKRKQLMSARGRLIRFDRPNYGEIAKDTAVGAGLSVAGTGALLYGTGKILNKRMPDLSHMLNTASKQHVNVFRPSKAGPMLRAIPKASGLFGKQLKGLAVAENLATGRKPTVAGVKRAIKKSGYTGQKDIDELKAFKKQHRTSPGDVMEKSVGMLSGVASTAIGGIGGAAMSHGWEPKKETRYSSKSKLIRFDDVNVRKKSTVGHDIATGALEGAALGPFTEPLFSYLQGEKIHPIMRGGIKGLGKRALIGGALGAGSTALIGSLVNVADKKRREKLASGNPILFAFPVSRSVITQDRYNKGVYDKDEERASKNYERSAIAGGGLSVLLRGKKTRVGTFIAGAGAGIGAQLATRALTSSSKDQFGDRSHLGKRIDKLPWQIPALVSGGIIGKRAYKAGALKMSSKGRLIQFISEDEEKRIGESMQDDRNWRKAKGQVGRATQGIKRGTRLTQDIIRGIKGQKNLDSRGRERKREWDKPWVRNAITGTIAVGTLAGFHRVIKSTGPGSQLGRMKEMYHKGDFHEAARNKIPGFKKAHDWVRGFKGDATGEAGAAAESSGMLGKMLDKVQKAAGRTGKESTLVHNPGGSTTVLPHGTTDRLAHDKRTMPSAEKEIAQTADEITKKQAARLREIQGGTIIKNSTKDTLIHFAAEDWEERKHGDLLHVAKIRRRNRRDKDLLERKDWQDSVVIPAKLGAAVLTGALGARLLGPRIIAGSNATRAVKRVRQTTDLRPAMQQVVNQHSLDPIIELSEMLDEALDPERKKKHRGLHIAEEALGAGAAAYGIMRRKTPLSKGTPQHIHDLRRAADEGGFARVVVHESTPGRRASAGPTIKQRLASWINQPADKQVHITEDSHGFLPKIKSRKHEGLIFDPNETGALKGKELGAETAASRAMDRSKLDEYQIATKAGIKMPHTAALTNARTLPKGYIIKRATGSQSGTVITAKDIKAHNPKHPDLLDYHKEVKRKEGGRYKIRPDDMGEYMSDHPGYDRWQTSRALSHPHEYVRQKRINIAEEFRVHTIGGTSLGITERRHLGGGILPFGRHKESEAAAEKILAKAHPSVKSNMMAMDIAKDTRGKYHVVEHNAGNKSGYLTPDHPGLARSSQQLYKRITGRYSRSASVAAGIGAAGAAAIGASAIPQDKRRTRAPIGK